MESSLTPKALQRLSTIGRHFPKIPKSQERKPMKVLVTGAAGQIGYILCFMIAQGRMLGPYQPVIIHTFDLPALEQSLKGLEMELKDGAFPLLVGLRSTTKIEEAFDDLDVAVLVGARPRGPGMERKDLLSANAAIFKEQGRALDKYSKKSVKVLVVGNPANTNAMIASEFAPSIPKRSFTALTRLDENRAKSQVADKLGSKVEEVKNLIIWGNHSATQFPDLAHGYLENYPKAGLRTSIHSAVNDAKWSYEDFVSTVQKRGSAIIAARKLSSAASAANAICDHVHDWVVGTNPGEWVSMGVMTDGHHYGIPAGINYSFPVICKDGVWHIVDGLKQSEVAQKKLQLTLDELLEEKKLALGN